jgi:hypothetical protein
MARDYELIAALSAFYGRVEELQWRLRYRLEFRDRADARVFDAMTEPLIAELRDEVADLISRVEKETKEPNLIEPLLGAAWPLVRAALPAVLQAAVLATLDTSSPP